jgi:RNA polymerase sigma factor (sigma-70 family)
VSFEELRATLARVVGRICPSWMAGQKDDLVQTACLRIVKKVSGTEELSSIGTSYLWRVAHSVLMDELRRRRRHPEAELNPTMQTEPAATEPTPEGMSAGSELSAAIAAGLKTLNDARRWAVLLYLYGFSLKDSAGMMGWTAKRVDNQRYQGLA